MSKRNDDDALLDPQSKVTENRAVKGWPGESELPFVGIDYYEEFAPKLRPIFEPGGPSIFNLTLEDMTRMREIYQRPFPLQTFINMSMEEHLTTIAGATPGSVIQVKVPPFGVLRGDPKQLGRIFVEGSRYWQFLPIGPEGDCNGLAHFKDVDGREYQTCDRYKCPRHPAGELIHSIQHAMHFISSVGEVYADMFDKSVAGYVPDEDKAQKKLFKYNKLDPRPEVTIFQGRRLQALAERKMRLEAARQPNP